MEITYETDDEKFARQRSSDLEADLFPLTDVIRTSLRLSYFTQFEDFGISPDGLKLKPLIAAYRTGDTTTRQRVIKALEYIRNHAPTIGTTFTHYFIQEAMDEIRAIRSSGQAAA